MDQLEKARVFALAAHGGLSQKRKYTFEDYITHPMAVVEIVRSIPHTQDMLVAAMLHDVIEDTGITKAVIALEFGERVADYVEGLSKVSRKEDGTRAELSAIDRVHLASQPAPVQTIKFGDSLHNLSCILKDVIRNPAAADTDIAHAQVYFHEKRLLVDALILGDVTLKARVESVLDQGACELHKLLK